LIGVTVIEVRVAVVTVTVFEPDTLPRVPAIVVLPVPTPVTSPLVPDVVLTDAMELLAEVQPT
jgi:hypothetical protein